MFYTLGFGTTHRVNNLILQNVGNFNQTQLQLSPKRKRSRRSFISDTVNNDVEGYILAKRAEPDAMVFYENEIKDFMFDDFQKLNFVWSLIRSISIPQSIPSWTGFHIEMTNDIPTLKTTVRYLDSINKPPTDMSTIYQVMNVSYKVS